MKIPAVRTSRHPRVVILGVLLLAGLFSGVHAFASSPSLDLDADATAEFQGVTFGAPPPFGGGLFASFQAITTRYPTNAITSPLSVGAVVGPDTGWGDSISATGLIGLRFQGRRGVHYGWTELTNPLFQGRPSFASGGWPSRVFYNPDPGQPISAGDTTIRLRAEVDPGTGQFRLFLNCDAVSFPSGLSIQARPALGDGTWTEVTRVFNGFSTTLPINSASKLFRVVQ